MAKQHLRRAASDRDWADDLNPWLDALLGNRPGYVRLVKDDGVRVDPKTGATLSTGAYQSIYRSEAGNHVAVLLSATAGDAVPSNSNAVVRITDGGFTIGAGKALVLAPAAGTPVSTLTATPAGDLQIGGTGSPAGSLVVGGNLSVIENISWRSGTPNTVTLDHAATAARTVAFQDRSGAVALLGAANDAGNLLFLDNAYDIGAAGATRPRSIYLGGTVAFSASTAFPVTLTHAATAARIATFPDASGTVLLAQAPVVNSAGSVPITGTVADALTVGLPAGRWLVIASLNWLPAGADAGAVLQATLTNGTGATVDRSPLINYTVDANLQRANGAAATTATVAAPGPGTVRLRVSKIGGTGSSSIEQCYLTAVCVG